MPSSKNTVAVVHLVWIPLGIEAFKSFVRSYITYKPGADHQLIFIFNGVNSEQDIQCYLNHLYENNLLFVSLIKKSGQDLEAYKWACTFIKQDVILFLNSYSAFHANDWLKIYLDHLTPQIGIISATGSYLSHYTRVFKAHKLNWDIDKSLLFNYRKYKLFVKAMLYWRLFFKPFPDKHLRTNAFMIRKKDFLKINIKLPIKTKFDAYKIESGYKSITNQILKMGYKAGVVGKDGFFYDLDNIKESNTFHIGKQENLLISDNQTQIYSSANDDMKKEMALLAWGK